MKLLILSDSHGEWRTLEQVTELERPDVVIHLGDYIGDAQKLSLVCDVPIEAVPGNCDGLFRKEGDGRILAYEGVRFFLTHGHVYRVKSGTEMLAAVGRQMGVDAVLFGHTHQALVERAPGGIWLVNPGTAGGVHAKATYALGTVEQGKVRFELKEME